MFYRAVLSAVDCNIMKYKAISNRRETSFFEVSFLFCGFSKLRLRLVKYNAGVEKRKEEKTYEFSP